MTPKEKASELFDKYLNYRYRFIDYKDYAVDIKSVKNCALIAVDELIKNSCNSKWRYMAFGTEGDSNSIYFKEYWQEVKQEIERL